MVVKISPNEVLINGKDVRDEQSRHVLLKSVPDEVSINGKDEREEQSLHVLWKLVKLPKSSLGAAPSATKCASTCSISPSLRGVAEMMYPTGVSSGPLWAKEIPCEYRS